MGKAEFLKVLEEWIMLEMKDAKLHEKDGLNGYGGMLCPSNPKFYSMGRVDTCIKLLQVIEDRQTRIH